MSACPGRKPALCGKIAQAARRFAIRRPGGGMEPLDRKENACIMTVKGGIRMKMMKRILSAALALLICLTAGAALAEEK